LRKAIWRRERYWAPTFSTQLAPFVPFVRLKWRAEVC
jgi:hypothetical protein